MQHFESIPDSKWDSVAESLRNSGAATIDFLPPAVCDIHASCFATAKRGLDAAKGDAIGGIRKIGASDDSAHATG